MAVAGDWIQVSSCGGAGMCSRPLPPNKSLNRISGRERVLNSKVIVRRPVSSDVRPHPLNQFVGS